MRKISSWVRQARHRAKQYGCLNRLNLSDALQIVENYGGGCAYCGEPAYGMDHVFLLSDRAPNVAANCLPSCKKCKDEKKNKDLMRYSQEGKISQERFLILIKEILTRDGGTELQEYIKNIIGICPS